MMTRKRIAAAAGAWPRAAGRPAICNLKSEICNPEGFTLIELLVVIVMLGMLAGLTMPAMIAANGRSHTAACEARLQEIGMAVRMYVSDYGVYPPSLDVLAAGRYVEDPETLTCVRTGQRFVYRPPAKGAGPQSVLAACAPPETPAGKRPHEAGSALVELLLSGKTKAVRR